MIMRVAQGKPATTVTAILSAISLYCSQIAYAKLPDPPKPPTRFMDRQLGLWGLSREKKKAGTRAVRGDQVP